MGCTNFEGVKILVFEGDFVLRSVIDPHFSEDYSPIARFKPTERGMELARKFAEEL